MSLGEIGDAYKMMLDAQRRPGEWINETVTAEAAEFIADLCTTHGADRHPVRFRIRRRVVLETVSVMAVPNGEWRAQVDAGLVSGVVETAADGDGGCVPGVEEHETCGRAGEDGRVDTCDCAGA